MTTTITELKATDLDRAYTGSFYTISGCGGDLNEWTKGVTEVLEERGIGTPVEWYSTTGAEINAYAATKGTVTDPFPGDLTMLMFPYTGLHTGMLAIFKLVAGDRWFDDIVDNMADADADDEDL